MSPSPSDEAITPVTPALQAPEPVHGPCVRIWSLQGDVCRSWEDDEAIAALPQALHAPGSRTWVDLCATGHEDVHRIAEILGLHPLLIEDILERDQRAKLEQVEGYVHLVMFSLGFDGGEIYDRELDFVLGPGFLLSSHSRWWDPTRSRLLRAGPRDALRRGADYLLWTLVDDVVDNYFPILDVLGDEIDDLEDAVVGSANRELLERLFALKRQLISIRRVTAPEREMFNALSSRESNLVAAEQQLYFRDAYDHLIRLTDELDTYRELVSATLETYLSTVNNNLSLIMKRLTGVTVVLAGVGAIGGLFGMSEAQFAFRGDEGLGFWIVLFGSVMLAAVGVAILRRNDWI